MIRVWVFALVIASFVPSSVHAAPVDDKVELLRSRPTGMDPEEWRKQRRVVARELGDVRSDKAVDALIEVVETERYDAVLSIAIGALGKQGDPRAIPALQRIYADRSLDGFVRDEAGKAIEALGGTPRDDARLVGGTAPGTASAAAGGPVSGPQIGAMGEASIVEDELADDPRARPLPPTIVARDREIAFVLGDLALDVNAPLRRPSSGRDIGNPVLADVGVGVLASHVDERRRWGWAAAGSLSFGLQNGDLTQDPAPSGADDGDTLYLRQGLRSVADVHLYFGRTDFHGFASLGVDERVSHVGIEGREDVPTDAALTDTRFALDVIPAAGFGWGRHLNAAADLMVDAIVQALRDENILARPVDAKTRAALQEAVYRHGRAFASYPRLAAVLHVLRTGGHLARAPGPRLVHKIRSIVDDPSYLERMRGIRVRIGFLYDAALLQTDYYLREGDHVGAPFVQFDSGFQLDRRRQILADLRFWYDALGDLHGFTTDAGLRYTRFFHTDYMDYRGQWFIGARGGVSQREYAADLDGDGNPEENDLALGYRAVAEMGYGYGFARGSELAVSARAGVDSSRLLLGVSIALRLGLVRASVWRSSTATVQGPSSSPSGSRAGNR